MDGWRQPAEAYNLDMANASLHGAAGTTVRARSAQFPNHILSPSTCLLPAAATVIVLLPMKVAMV